jgi:hypothetical protein
MLAAQQPLSKLVKLEPSDQLTQAERGYFYKANVDYTFCDRAGQPLLSVEFDGIGGGYSRNGIYVPERVTSDRQRPWKLNFKLRVTREAGYPLIVVSFDETEALTEDDSLTALDAIVGRFLADHFYEQRMVRLVRDLGWPSEQAMWDDEYAFQDLAWAMVDADREYDPVSRAGDLLELELNERGIYWGHLSTAQLYKADGSEEPIETTDREVLARAALVGARATLLYEDGVITETVWLRNVGSEFGSLVPIAATRIASYLALRRLRGLHPGAPQSV